MGTISVSLPSDGETIDAADYNTPINTIVTAINGNLDNANINTSAAIAGSKLATDSVTDTQLDYPRWWQEIGRTTLSGAGDTISVTSIPARAYLKVIVFTQSTGGTTRTIVRFNNDSGNNYAYRSSTNGAADATATSQSGIIASASAASDHFFVAYITNVLALEKRFTTEENEGVSGAGTAPGRIETIAKWANTAAQITRIDVINDGTGDFAIGSEVVVLGHD